MVFWFVLFVLFSRRSACTMGRRPMAHTHTAKSPARYWLICCLYFDLSKQIFCSFVCVFIVFTHRDHISKRDKISNAVRRGKKFKISKSRIMSRYLHSSPRGHDVMNNVLEIGTTSMESIRRE